MENSEATTSSPNITSVQASTYPKAPANIDNLPNELIDLIFQSLSICCQTCLGVTCKTLYGNLKKDHPRPIHLHKQIKCCNIAPCYFWHDERLGYVLQDWSGLSRYRLCKTYPDPKHPWVFLKKEFYGDFDDSEPEQKMKRWWDYFQSPSIGKHAFLSALLTNNSHPLWFFILVGFIGYHHPLLGQPYWTGHPNPRGIHMLVPKPWGISGEDWTAHMMRVIKDDLPCWGGDWHGFWRFWEQTWVMTENWPYIEPVNQLRPFWFAVNAHEDQA